MEAKIEKTRLEEILEDPSEISEVLKNKIGIEKGENWGMTL